MTMKIEFYAVLKTPKDYFYKRCKDAKIDYCIEFRESKCPMNCEYAKQQERKNEIKNV